MHLRHLSSLVLASTLVTGCGGAASPPPPAAQPAAPASAQPDEPSIAVTPELGRPEHHECRWLTLDDALALASPRVKPVLEWAAKTIGITPS